MEYATPVEYDPLPSVVMKDVEICSGSSSPRGRHFHPHGPIGLLRNKIIYLLNELVVFV